MRTERERQMDGSVTSKGQIKTNKRTKLQWGVNEKVAICRDTEKVQRNRS